MSTYQSSRATLISTQPSKPGYLSCMSDEFRNRRLIRDRILVVAGMDVADAGLKWTGWSFAAGWKLRN